MPPTPVRQTSKDRYWVSRPLTKWLRILVATSAFLTFALSPGPVAAGSLNIDSVGITGTRLSPGRGDAINKFLDRRKSFRARTNQRQRAPFAIPSEIRSKEGYFRRLSINDQSRRRIGCVGIAKSRTECGIIYIAEAKKKKKSKQDTKPKLKRTGPRERIEVGKKLIPLGKMPDAWIGGMGNVWSVRKGIDGRWRRFRRVDGKKISINFRKAYAAAFKKKFKKTRLKTALRVVRRYRKLYESELRKLRRKKLRPGEPRQGRLTMEQTLENLKALEAQVSKELSKQIAIEMEMKAAAKKAAEERKKKSDAERSKKTKKTVKKKCKGGSLSGALGCVTKKMDQ